MKFYACVIISVLSVLLTRSPANASTSPDKTLKKLNTLLVVQRHPINSSHVYTYHQEGLKPGGGLWIANLTGFDIIKKEILDSSDGIILDANIHYDGKTILFSWKKTMKDFFQLYTINVDGTDLKQITNHESNNFNASFVPDGGIVFLLLANNNTNTLALRNRRQQPETYKLKLS